MKVSLFQQAPYRFMPAGLRFAKARSSGKLGQALAPAAEMAK